MSVNSLILNQKKEWCNIRVNNLTVDGNITHNGSGGAGFYVEVSTFTELKNAIDAGEKRIHIVANMTATTNLEIQSGTYYLFFEGLLTMGSYVFDMQNLAGTVMRFESESKGDTYGIVWNPPVAISLFYNDDQTQELEFVNFAIGNLSATVNTPIQNTAVVRAFNSDFDGGLTVDKLFNFVDDDCMMQNCTANTGSIVVSGKGVNISNCFFEAVDLEFTSADFMKATGCHFIDGNFTIQNTVTNAVVADCTSENAVGGFTYSDLGTTTRKANCSF